jgi:tubulin-specific chaperone E
MSSAAFYVGKRLSYDGNLCTVRYLGKVQGTEGDWLGVEWDDPGRGKNSGEARGVKYFECLSPSAGSFIRPTRPFDEPRTFIAALRHKYVGDEEHLPKEKHLRISGKEVEEVGFDKIKKKQAVLNQLKRVFLEGLRISLRDIRTSSDNNIKDIGKICPKIIDLDLSNNLFERFDEITRICEQLLDLNSLRLDGNRFSNVQLPYSLEATQNIFSKVSDLSLENTFLEWSDIVSLCLCFPLLTKLSLLRNNLSKLQGLPTQLLPQSLTTLNLAFNRFEILGDGLDLLTSLPNLQKLMLYQCGVKTISSASPTFSETLSEVDLSYNEIDSWSFIDRLQEVFPGLKHLLISHNPLFQAFSSTEDTATADLLVTARLSNITKLNNSLISGKYRQEAEIYYISTVVREMELQTDKTEEQILSSNPRYTFLCSLYEAPVYRRQKNKVHPNSLAARLASVTLILEDSALDRSPPTVTVELPKEMSIYALIGQVGRLFDISPLDILLFRRSHKIIRIENYSSSGDDFWDSEEEEEEEEEQETKTVVQDIPVIPSTRTIGTTFDGDIIRLIIKLRK